MNFLKNFWFYLKTKKRPKLTDAKTQNIIEQHNQLDNKLVESLTMQKWPTLKQLQYLGKMLNPKDKLILRIAGIIMAIATVFVLINSYFLYTKISPDLGGEYTEGLVGIPQYINSILAQTNDVDMDISTLIFNGLLKYDPNSGLIPDLAKNYSISEDQKTYTFELREDIYWHDGRKFSANDVLFTMERIKDPNTKSPLFFNFKGVVIEKIDDQTIRFILDEPFAPFIENLMVGILPAHIWSGVPAQNTNLSDLNIKPIGTGPFKFSALTKDTRTGEIKTYTLERNEKYHQSSAFIKKIIFKFYPTFDLAIDALNNKNIQGISFLPKEKLSGLINNRSLNLNLLNLPQYTGLFINLKKDSILKDVKIRKALARAINKQEIVTNALNDQAQTIESPILPGQLGQTQDFTIYQFAVEQAKQELEDIEWKLTDYVKTPNKVEADNNNSTTENKPEVIAEETYPFQVRQKKNTYLEITLTTINQPDYLKIAEMIQKSWQLIGVKTNLRVLEIDQVQKEILRDRNYEILLYGENLGYDPDPYPFWHTSQINYPGLNLSGYSNSKVDKLLEEARKTTSIETREKNYIEFQKMLAEDVPAIFLYNPTYTYPQAKLIKGYDTHTIIVPANRFTNINNWYIKTKRTFSQ